MTFRYIVLSVQNKFIGKNYIQTQKPWKQQIFQKHTNTLYFNCNGQ